MGSPGIAQVWCFDLDGCLVDSMAATHLRPHAAELLAALERRGAEVHLWSAGGADYARRVAGRVGIDGYFHGFHEKVRRDDGRWALPRFPPGVDVVCVDDQPDGVPAEVETIAVFPYLGVHPHDRALARILSRLGDEKS